MDFDRAVAIMQAAKDAGADAIKIQTYTPDTITLDCDDPCFQITQGTIWDGTTLHKLYETAYTPWEWQPKLKKIAEEMGPVSYTHLDVYKRQVQGIKEVKISGKEQYFVSEYRKCGKGYVDAVQRYSLYNQVPKLLIETACVATMVGYMIFLVATGVPTENMLTVFRCV